MQKSWKDISVAAGAGIPDSQIRTRKPLSCRLVNRSRAAVNTWDGSQTMSYSPIDVTSSLKTYVARQVRGESEIVRWHHNLRLDTVSAIKSNCDRGLTQSQFDWSMISSLWRSVIAICSYSSHVLRYCEMSRVCCQNGSSDLNLYCWCFLEKLAKSAFRAGARLSCTWTCNVPLQ